MKDFFPSKEQIRAFYKGVPQLGLKTDIQGWHYDEPIFERLVNEVRPLIYLEVGCYKGASILRVASLAKALGLDIRCIGVDFWAETGLYQQFLHNVVASGHDDCIVPMHAHSVDAAETLKKLSFQADLIYIDAGHSYEDCLRDMLNYWPLLREGGVMFGDDYTEEPGVKEAVIEFGKPFSNTYYHWEIRPKTSA